MEKKLYEICISGESGGSCKRYLTDYEYNLIRDIFDECESEYCGGSIYLVEDDTDKMRNKQSIIKIKEDSFCYYYNIGFSSVLF